MKYWLKRKVTWPGWKLAVFKWSTASFGVLLALYFPDFCRSFLWFFWPMFIFGSIAVTKWWFCSKDEDQWC